MDLWTERLELGSPQRKEEGQLTVEAILNSILSFNGVIVHGAYFDAIELAVERILAAVQAEGWSDNESDAEEEADGYGQPMSRSDGWVQMGRGNGAGMPIRRNMRRPTG